MRIKSVRVKNFKSFKDLEVNLGQFNVLIGENASGKSNFVRVIEFLRDVQRLGLENAISLQGGAEYITNLNVGSEGNLSAEVVVSADPGAEESQVVATSRAEEGLLFLEPQEARYSFSVRFLKRGTAFSVTDERLSVKGNFHTFEQFTENPRPPSGRGHGEIVLSRGPERPDVRVVLPESLSAGKYDFMPWLIPQKVPGSSLTLASAPSVAGKLVTDVAIYDFDPKLPKKATPITGKAELEENGSNLAIVLKRIIESRPAKRKLTNFLKDILPFVVGMNVEKFADKSLLFSLRETYSKKKHLPASLISDGTVNVTALIVALYFEKKPIMVIEEPERNIHPFLISRITGMMKDASQKKQIIVTTHNPELVRNAHVDDILLVSRDEEGFSTITRPKELDDVKIFLQNDMGLDELFADNLLHA
jgi:predicted ATPase